MTDPDRPAATPAGPTPEEISARLEALLKRTHALKANKASEPAAPLTMTWPPPERELDHYDVMDVPEDDRMTAPPPPASPGPQAAAPAAPVATAPAAGEKTADSFARPDWSELRLRAVPDEPSGRSRAWILLTVLLAVVAIGQAAYIFMGPPKATAEGRLRVDGPDGALVRVNGQAIGPAPIDHVLAPGDYDVEVGIGKDTARVDRVSIGVGRTVVLLPAAIAPPPAASASPAVQASSTPAPPVSRPAPDRPAPPAPAPGPTSNPAATAAAAVSAGLGGVLIESTPSGLPVTMEGRERGVTPITIGQLKPGRHDVLVGGLPRKVDISAGRVASLRVARP